MTDNLPPELLFQFVDEGGRMDDVIQEQEDEETKEENPNFVYEEPNEQSSKKATLELPSIEKEDINTDAIFESQLETSHIKHNIQALTIETEKKQTKKPEAFDEDGNPVKLNKNGKPRKKRVYTDAQREAMRQRLIKTRANIGKNKEKKQEEKDKVEKHKTLMNKKRDMEMEEVEEKIIEKAKPKEQQKNTGFTREEMKEAQLEAIMEYDALRKKRKAKKNEEKMVQKHKEDLKNLVRKELGWQETAGKYSGCY